MPIEVIDHGDDYLILRSGVTGLVYGAMFDADRGAEVLKAAPIAEFMAGRAVTVKRASQAPRELPAGKPAKKPRKHGGGVKKGVSSPRFDRVLEILKEAGRPMSAAELKEATGYRNGTDIYRIVRAMEDAGRLQTTETPFTNSNGRTIKLRLWFPAVEEAPDQP